MSFAPLEPDQDGLVTDPEHESTGDPLPDEVQNIDFLEALTTPDDDSRTPIAKGLKYVRERFRLRGAEYEEYWRLVVKALLAKKKKDQVKADANAARLLTEIQTKMEGKTWKWHARQLPHAELMEHAQQRARKIADEAARFKETERVTTFRKDALKGLLTELTTPLSYSTLIREIERQIRELEDGIALEDHILIATLKPSDKVSVGPVAEQAPVTEVVETEHLPKDARKEAQPRILIEAQKAAQVAKEEEFVTDTVTEAIAEQSEGIPSEKPEEVTIDPRQKIAELKEILQLCKRDLAAVKVFIAEQKRKLESVRTKKIHLHGKRRDLLQQFEDLEKQAQQSRMSARPKRTDGMRDGLDDILDQALGRTSSPLDAGLTSAFKSLGETPMRRLEFQAANSVDVVTPTKKLTATPAKRKSATKVDKLHALAEVAPGVKAPLRFGQTASQGPASLRPGSFAQSYNALRSSAPGPKPSDSLYLKVPASNTIYIDDTLTIDLSAPISALQTQAFKMQLRLRSSYPRIDNLPYEVWTSENLRTLQTWLKIMASRWRAGVDKVVPSKSEAEKINQALKAVLDQMVRDHDLSNEAAERMARHWNEVVSQRGAIEHDTDDTLDWDILDAGGFGFLKVEEEEAEMRTEKNHNLEPTVAPKKMLVSGNRFGNDNFEGLLRRPYSTSARPPRDAATPLPTESEACTSPPCPQGQSSAPYGTQLPHLTSTGTAHMVSVSTKSSTVRIAIAVGTVYFSNPTPLSLIRSASIEKGDVLSVSRIAGIMAAKKCPDIVPLCHPLLLSHISVELIMLDTESKDRSHITANMGFGGIEIEAKVSCTGPTGVEMEALTAVMGAALTVVDMCKAVDKAQRVQDVRVVRKEGGRSGTWVEQGWQSSREV